MMRKLLIIAFFVALTATPAAAQPMTAPAVAPATRSAATAPVMSVAPKPVVMRPAPRPVPRPATVKPSPVTKVSTMKPAAPVAAMAAPVDMAAAPAMAPEGPVMAAAPAEPAKAAPAAKKDSKGSVVGGWVLQLLLGILGIALPIILTPVVLWILKKMKVEDAKAQMLVDEMVDKAIGVGIHYAEEQAHKLKDNPVDGAAKLNMAGEKAQAYLKDSKIVDKGSEYLKDLIESKLGETRPAGVRGVKPAAFEEKAPEEEKEEPSKEKGSDDK